MAEVAPIRILCIGVEAASMKLIEAACVGGQFTKVTTVDVFGSSYEQWDDSSFDAIFCGPTIDGVAGTELAQVLVNQAPGSIKYYITENPMGYEPRLLIKNGFTASFLIPMDAPLVRQAMLENIQSAASNKRSMRTVRVLDIGAGDPLSFETYIYLPRNKKYIRYTAANQPVESTKIEKLASHQMSQLFVDHRDMNKFYQYSAKKLRELGEGSMSSTEKQEKLKDSVRTLFSDIFDASIKSDFDQGREMIKQCESIISNYITKGVSSNWYKKLLSSIGDGGDVYNHASNVSTFAALFAIGTGHPNPEDLAMAGLFHDLGMSQLPNELQARKENTLTEVEKLTFYTHAEKSLLAIKNKRIIIPDSVEKAILMHHEAWNGRGYPRQLIAGRISQEAQILSFADQFDYLTRSEEGQTRLKPLEALDAIRRTGSINPDLLAQFRKLLDPDQVPAKSA